jgi:hypothetical protein
MSKNKHRPVSQMRSFDTHEGEGHTHEADLLRAEGEGMLATDDAPSASPRIQRMALVRAHADAKLRRLKDISVPMFRARAGHAILKRPFLTLGLAVAAGIGIGLLLQPSKRRLFSFS